MGYKKGTTRVAGCDKCYEKGTHTSQRRCKGSQFADTAWHWVHVYKELTGTWHKRLGKGLRPQLRRSELQAPRHGKP